MPASTLRRVLLPAPLAPMIARRSVCLMSRVMPLNARTVMRSLASRARFPCVVELSSSFLRDRLPPQKIGNSTEMSRRQSEAVISDPIGDPGAEPGERGEAHAAAKDRHDQKDNPRVLGR